MYHLDLGERVNLARRQLFKWRDAEQTYDPWLPWWGEGARFHVSGVKTLYLAESPEGALAEFLRRHPELVGFQDDLAITMFRLLMEVAGESLDVRSEGQQSAVGITRAQLTSSDADETTRYEATQQLAAEVVAADLSGILYPSAAAAWVNAWNLVLFESENLSGWRCVDSAEVAVPTLTIDQVHPLS